MRLVGESHSMSWWALSLAWWLQSQVYGEIAPTRITSVAVRRLQRLVQTVPEKGHIASQSSRRVHKGKVPTGSICPLMSALLIHGSNCSVDVLWLLEFEKAAPGAESCLYNPECKWILSAKQHVFKESSDINKACFPQNWEWVFSSVNTCTHLWQMPI